MADPLADDGIDWKQKYDSLREEYEDFTASSQELEQEMEAELNNTSAERDALKEKEEKLREEILALRTQALQESTESNREVLTTQSKLTASEAELAALRERKREWEQEKDDLERNLRMVQAQAQSSQDKLDAVEEDYVVLQEDFDEWRSQQLTLMGHLKEQLRDAIGEIAKWKQAAADAEAKQRAVEEELEALRSNHSIPNPISPESITVKPPEENSPEEDAPMVAIVDESLLTTPDRRHTKTVSMHSPLQFFGAGTTAETSPGAAAVVTRHRQTFSAPEEQDSGAGTVPSEALNPRERALAATTGVQPKTFADRKHIFLLCAGAMFKKHRLSGSHEIITKRLVWTSSNLRHIMWGTASKDVRGFLPVAQVTTIVPGQGKDILKIFIIAKNNTLILECYDKRKHALWVEAFNWLTATAKQQSDEWQQVISDVPLLQSLISVYNEYMDVLRKGAGFIRFPKSASPAEEGVECKLYMTQALDRMEWLDFGEVCSPKNDNISRTIAFLGAAGAPTRMRRFIMLDDMCDVNDFVRGHPTRFVVMAAHKSIIVEPSLMALRVTLGIDGDKEKGNASATMPAELANAAGVRSLPSLRTEEADVDGGSRSSSSTVVEVQTRPASTSFVDALAPLTKAKGISSESPQEKKRSWWNRIAARKNSNHSQSHSSSDLRHGLEKNTSDQKSGGNNATPSDMSDLSEESQGQIKAAALEQKQKWVEAIRFVVTYTQKLRHIELSLMRKQLAGELDPLPPSRLPPPRPAPNRRPPTRPLG